MYINKTDFAYNENDKRVSICVRKKKRLLHVLKGQTYIACTSL
jgi:hypothetical protein